MTNLRLTVLIAALLVAATSQLQSADEFTVTQSPGATGGIDFTVKNNRDVPLTGFTVRAVYHPAKGSDVATYIYDSLANGPSQPALRRGESYTLHRIIKNPTDVRPPDYSVDAAIFADGLAIGDPIAIQSLWKRREWAAIGLEQVFQDLDSSVTNVENTLDAIATLQRLENQRLPPGTPREERSGIDDAYGTVIAGLQLVDDRRAIGFNESATARIAALRNWAAQRISAIRSQVRPAQVSDLHVQSTAH